MGSTLLGVMAGVWIRRTRPLCAAPALVYGGAVLTIAGLLWGETFPINKSLWTSSYVLFTAGAAAIAVGVLHRDLDDGRATAVTTRLSEPLVALGRNAMLLFVLSGLAGRTMMQIKVSDAAGEPTALQPWIYQTAFAPLAAPKNASLLYAVTCLVLLYALLAWLHRRRWYWSV